MGGGGVVRSSRVERVTGETRVFIDLRLSRGDITVDTGIGFLNHLTETLIYYAGFSGVLRVEEVKSVDDHHIAEDLYLALGEALIKASGVRVARFGYSIIPMDEVLSLASVDVSGRPGAWIEIPFTRDSIGGLSTEVIPHMIQSMASSMKSTIHVMVLRPGNNHHMAEASFKALGIALGKALEPRSEVLSTKGVI